MTNDDVVKVAVNDPQVVQAHTTFKDGQPTSPPVGSLESLANTELQNELRSLLGYPSIRRVVLERDYPLTLSTGTTVTQGVKFTLPDYVRAVLGVTIGTELRPLKTWKTREDFDKWYFTERGTSASTDTAEGYLLWQMEDDGKLTILVSPGIGSDTTANVRYIRKMKSPLQVTDLPEEVHNVITTGLKRRLTNGTLFQEYDSDLKRALRYFQVVVGGASPMPLDREQEDFNWIESVNVSGPLSSDSPLFISRRQ